MNSDIIISSSRNSSSSIIDRRAVQSCFRGGERYISPGANRELSLSLMIRSIPSKLYLQKQTHSVLTMCAIVYIRTTNILKYSVAVVVSRTAARATDFDALNIHPIAS